MLLDPIGLEWYELSNSTTTGAPPSPRSGHGFAPCGGKLFVFGGVGPAANSNSFISVVASTPDAVGESLNNSILPISEVIFHSVLNSRNPEVRGRDTT